MWAVVRAPDIPRARERFTWTIPGLFTDLRVPSLESLLGEFLLMLFDFTAEEGMWDFLLLGRHCVFELYLGP